MAWCRYLNYYRYASVSEKLLQSTVKSLNINLVRDIELFLRKGPTYQKWGEWIVFTSFQGHSTCPLQAWLGFSLYRKVLLSSSWAAILELSAELFHGIFLYSGIYWLFLICCSNTVCLIWFYHSNIGLSVFIDMSSIKGSLLISWNGFMLFNRSFRLL